MQVTAVILVTVSMPVKHGACCYLAQAVEDYSSYLFVSLTGECFKDLNKNVASLLQPATPSQSVKVSPPGSPPP